MSILKPSQTVSNSIEPLLIKLKTISNFNYVYISHPNFGLTIKTIREMN